MYSDTENISFMKELQAMLHTNNRYVRELKSIYDREMSNNGNIEEIRVVIRDAAIPGLHQRQTNAPTVNEIAVIMSGDEETTKRDIIIEGRFTAYNYLVVVPPAKLIYH